MSSLTVESLQFTFESTVAAERYDEWKHYRLVLNRNGGVKAVDVVAIEAQATMWLVEAKDFRIITVPPKPSNLGGLARTVNQKVRDSLSGLQDAAQHARARRERRHASAALNTGQRRIVLHLEPHVAQDQHSALFPRNYAANILLQLRQLVRDIDRQPLVLTILNTSTAGVPWTVS